MFPRIRPAMAASTAEAPAETPVLCDVRGGRPTGGRNTSRPYRPAPWRYGTVLGSKQLAVNVRIAPQSEDEAGRMSKPTLHRASGRQLNDGAHQLGSAWYGHGLATRVVVQDVLPDQRSGLVTAVDDPQCCIEPLGVCFRLAVADHTHQQSRRPTCCTLSSRGVRRIEACLQWTREHRQSINGVVSPCCVSLSSRKELRQSHRQSMTHEWHGGKGNSKRLCKRVNGIGQVRTKHHGESHAVDRGPSAHFPCAKP